MDLHKIIHSALHEFIQAYIPDADLRWENAPDLLFLTKNSPFAVLVYASFPGASGYPIDFIRTGKTTTVWLTSIISVII